MGSNIGTMLYEQVANSNSASLILNIFVNFYHFQTLKYITLANLNADLQQTMLKNS